MEKTMKDIQKESSDKLKLELVGFGFFAVIAILFLLVFMSIGSAKNEKRECGHRWKMNMQNKMLTEQSIVKKKMILNSLKKCK